MNGIEKITGRIEADAREQASAITADAEAKCAEIRADYDKQAQDQYWARVRDGVKTCEDRVQRMGRLAEMEARKSILALKQEMVDAAFAAALERICTICLLYTSDAADDSLRVDLGGRRIIKKIF